MLFSQMATLHSFVQDEDCSLSDLDMFFFESFPTAQLYVFLTGDISLSNRYAPSRLARGQMCCIIDQPVKVYIADGQKHRFAVLGGYFKSQIL